MRSATTPNITITPANKKTIVSTPAAREEARADSRHRRCYAAYCILLGLPCSPRGRTKQDDSANNVHSAIVVTAI